MWDLYSVWLTRRFHSHHWHTLPGNSTRRRDFHLKILVGRVQRKCVFMRCVSRRFARCFLSLFINRGSGSILWCLFSRKERSVSLNFPGHLHQTAVRQPIHLGSFDLEKYLQQTFSVAKKSTDFFKIFSLLNSWMERTKGEMPHNWFFWIWHNWPEWIDSCNLHLQGPGGILC